tara:strand:+ start:2593 stop:2844 length:252 start_codon:yes stop_codon:yes gene_type:complete
MKWEIQTRKGGAEIYVECEDRSIFIGEGYSHLEYGQSIALASVIKKALNEYEEAYECHDKGTNAHFDEMPDDQAFFESTGGRN